jgi:hypothetical protein
MTPKIYFASEYAGIGDRLPFHCREDFNPPPPHYAGRRKARGPGPSGGSSLSLRPISIHAHSSWTGMAIDQEALLEQLVAAVRQVWMLEKRVADQLQIVELLEHYGRDTTIAREALAFLERTHRINSARRNKLRVLLEDLTARAA